MAAIYFFSSIPSSDMPDFSWADLLVKKGGHVIGYGLLAVSLWYALGLDPRRLAAAWGLAVLYALTDEFHQAFVPGRHPSWGDVLLFDASGALAALLLLRRLLRRPPGGR